MIDDPHDFVYELRDIAPRRYTDRQVARFEGQNELDEITVANCKLSDPATIDIAPAT